MKITEALELEINTEIEKLKELKPGTDEHQKVANTIAELCDKLIALKKLEQEAGNGKFERKNKWIQHGLTALGMALPFGTTIWGTLKSLKFEETGTITTTAGRNFFSSLFRKK